MEMEERRQPAGVREPPSPRASSGLKNVRTDLTMPAVVLLETAEHRLSTELARNRPDRWVPIALHLAKRGYNEALLTSALPAFSAFKPILDLLA